MPIPPSLNKAYRNVPKVGRVKSSTYRAWEKLADGYALLSPRTSLTGDVVAVFAYGRPDRRRRDLDNHAKLVLDRMVAWNVLGDDSQVIDLRLYWSPNVPPGMVYVTLEEISQR